MGMPEMRPLQPDSTLESHVRPQSWFFIERIDLNPSFLQEPIEDWPSIPDFKTFANFVKNCPVINDECERLCKHTSDYGSIGGKEEEDIQATLQLVDSALRKLPSRHLKSDICRAYVPIKEVEAEPLPEAANSSKLITRCTRALSMQCAL